MKYENAKDILPPDLIVQIQKYAAGKLLYIPKRKNLRLGGAFPVPGRGCCSVIKEFIMNIKMEKESGNCLRNIFYRLILSRRLFMEKAADGFLLAPHWTVPWSIMKPVWQRSGSALIVLNNSGKYFIRSNGFVTGLSTCR